MAIDTASKRRAVAGISVRGGVSPLASPTSEWRASVAQSYGFEAEEPPVLPDITTNLVWHLPMQDSAASTTVVAAVGSDGTLVDGGNTSAARAVGPGGLYPWALTVNGSNSYVNGGNDAALTPTGAFTLAIRVFSTNYAASNYGMMVAKHDGTAAGATYSLRFNATTRIPQFTGTTGGSERANTGSFAFTNGQWYHVVGVYDTFGFYLYVNGALTGNVAAGTGGPPVPTTTESIACGARKPTAPEFFFNGRVCDARLYSRALSADDVAALYQVGVGGLQSDPTLPPAFFSPLLTPTINYPGYPLC